MLLLVLALQWPGSSALLLARTARYDPSPRPETVADMRKVDTLPMQLLRLNASNDVIYGYPRNEDKYVSGELADKGGWDTDRVSTICELFREIGGRGSFLDVGANIGGYSIPMARCLEEQGHGGHVIAVEGIRMNAEHLMASAYKNRLADLISIFNYAVVGDASTASHVRMNIAPSNKGGSSVSGYKPPGLIEGDEVQDGGLVDVRATTVDAIMRMLGKGRYQPVFAMKLDIEGSEGHALNGARRLLASPPCVLQIELKEEWLERAGTPMLAIAQLLSQAGYVREGGHDIDITSHTNHFDQLLYQKDYEGCKARFAQ